MTRIPSGLAELLPRYRHFIVDLWGVVHDGVNVYPDALPALERLAASGARVVFLTNASRTSDSVTEMLVSHLGIARGLFHGVVSSGDVTREAITGRDEALASALGSSPRCYHVGEREYVSWLFELGLSFVDDPGDADVIFSTGTLRDHAALDAIMARIEGALARGVPLVCTNPDRVVPTPSGFTLGPGALAHVYRQRGGETFLYGKPHAPAYVAARRALGAKVSEPIVALGDTLETDIRGARDAGIDAVLIARTGVHGPELGPSLEEEELEALFAREGIRPDMVLDRFRW